MTDTRAPLRMDSEVTDQDVLQAMQEMQGYLDITPGDFKELYLKAFRHARKRLADSRTAGEIMTAQVVTVDADTPLREVAAIMAQRGVAGVPVVDPAGKVAGVISEKDFLSLMREGNPGGFMAVVAGCLSASGCLVAQTAADVMSTPAICVSLDDTVGRIAELFSSKGINRAPVVGGDGRLLGIVTRGDLLRQSPPGQRP